MSGDRGPASTGRCLPSLDLPLPERGGKTVIGDISCLSPHPHPPNTHPYTRQQFEIEQNRKGKGQILGSSVLPLSSELPADSLRASSCCFLPERLHLYHFLSLWASPGSLNLLASSVSPLTSLLQKEEQPCSLLTYQVELEASGSFEVAGD